MTGRNVDRNTLDGLPSPLRKQVVELISVSRKQLRHGLPKLGTFVPQFPPPLHPPPLPRSEPEIRAGALTVAMGTAASAHAQMPSRWRLRLLHERFL